MKDKAATSLPAFQQAAADLIVGTLSSRSGPRRFLLADEVGLGKTHVAAEVIRQLRMRRGLSVIYVCSNTEIARQNVARLGRDVQELPIERLTLLASRTREITAGRRKRQLQIFPLTPGTSFDIGHGTGLAEERRLLIYLVHRMYGIPVSKTREAFRGNAGKRDDPANDTWRRKTSMPSLRKDLRGLVGKQLVRRLRREWSRELVGRVLGAKESRLRNRAIGDLRLGLARAVVDALKPDLVILDEFQRYRSLIDVVSVQTDDRSVKAALFGTPARIPVLLLSATPYRLYTTRAEDQDRRSHWDELLEVLRFLRRETSSRWTGELANKLERFQQLLKTVAGDTADQKSRSELIKLKLRLEAALGSVMCRTERNWYVDAAGENVRDLPDKRVQFPDSEAVAEFVRIRRGSVGRRGSGHQVADFWKSCPSFLSFMGSRYALTASLGKAARPMQLRERQLSRAHRTNLKLSYLFEGLFPSGRPATRPNLSLWVRPSYVFYRSGEPRDGDREPAKFLVFSHWRFVPGAIAGLASLNAEQRLGIRPPRMRRGLSDQFALPLRLEKGGPFTAFDLCFPDPLLARMADPLAIAQHLSSAPAEVPRQRLEESTRKELSRRLREAKVSIGTGVTRPWQIAAWLAQWAGDSQENAGALRRGQRRSELPLKDFARRYAVWSTEAAGDSRELRVSKGAIAQLARIALYSPANCLYRCFLRTFGEVTTKKVYPDLVLLGMTQLRAYWNRATTQATVNREFRRRTYSERSLDYCAAHQLEAVLDEYVFLLASYSGLNGDGAEALAAASGVIRLLSRVFGLGAGSPVVHVRKSRPLQLRSHFAAAFTEDDESNEREAQGRSERRAAMREAFNSPFWPFVLATTSVGQEGLDFHLYCRDIVHWNLPTNPVDLEQREGRINRRNSLAIRRSICADVHSSLLREADVPLMKQAFSRLLERAPRHEHEKHGLYPYWVYEGDAGHQIPFRRHLPFYESSADVDRYKRLRRRLSLYRLAFGQANQDDLLDELESKADPEIDRRLARYMLNLAPFRGAFAWNAARTEATRRLDADGGSTEWLTTLCRDSDKKLAEVRGQLAGNAVAACKRLIHFVQDSSATANGHVRRDAVAALVYFRNPYDDRFDVHRDVGLQDDARRMIQAASRISPRS